MSAYSLSLWYSRLISEVLIACRDIMTMMMTTFTALSAALGAVALAILAPMTAAVPAIVDVRSNPIMIGLSTPAGVSASTTPEGMKMQDRHLL